ncbi:hypothetical protein C8R48DRAFT_832848 [Suillus tomentosus]|nr:hypothetical protein C8R48DRAFT_832848 [Suillus tomentosus]
MINMASKKWAHPLPLCAAVGPAGTNTSAVDGIAVHTVTSPDDQDSTVYLTEIQLRKVTVVICERSALILFWKHPAVRSIFARPSNINHQDVKTLSGGELQRVAIVLALGKPNVSVYLLDEPSSFLDSEQRIIASKVIKRFVGSTLLSKARRWLYTNIVRAAISIC